MFSYKICQLSHVLHSFCPKHTTDLYCIFNFEIRSQSTSYHLATISLQVTVFSIFSIFKLIKNSVELILLANKQTKLNLDKITTKNYPFWFLFLDFFFNFFFFLFLMIRKIFFFLL